MKSVRKFNVKISSKDWLENALQAAEGSAALSLGSRESQERPRWGTPLVVSTE